MSPTRGLPVVLNLEGRPVVVVGAGSVARRRALAVLEAGGDLTWVAPDAPPELRARVLARPFRAGDLDGAFVVFACASPTVNGGVCEAAEARGVLVCSAAARDGGALRLMATARRGPVCVAVATGVPAATAALRDRLEALVPTAWAEFVGLVGATRARLPSGPQRRARLVALARGPLLDRLVAGPRDEVDGLLDRA